MPELRQLNEAAWNASCLHRRTGKVIWIDGVPHRRRRGKLVVIPDAWFGQVPHKQTMRQRNEVRRRTRRVGRSKRS